MSEAGFENSMYDFLHWDFSSNVMTITEAQIAAARLEREKLQAVHEGALQIDIWKEKE